MSDILFLSGMAESLDVSEEWVQEQAEARQIPCLKIEGRYLFNPEAVVAALASRAAGRYVGDGMDGVSEPITSVV